jgi:hypothetical protein
MLQLVLHRNGFCLIRDNGHAGFVGSSRVPVQNGQTHRMDLPARVDANLIGVTNRNKVRKIPMLRLWGPERRWLPRSAYPAIGGSSDPPDLANGAATPPRTPIAELRSGLISIS